MDNVLIVDIPPKPSEKDTNGESYENNISDRSFTGLDTQIDAATFFNDSLKPLLSPAAALIVKLHYFDGKSCREIGQILGKNEASIYPILAKIVNDLKNKRRTRVDFELNNSIVSPGFGGRIVKLETALGVSRAKFGRMIGVSGSAVRRWETGIFFPRYNAIATFAAATGIPLEYFLKGEKTEIALASPPVAAEGARLEELSREALGRA